jgi:hypothetical protein
MKLKTPSPREAFINAFFEGLAAPGLLFCPREPPRLNLDPPRPGKRRSDLEILRGDWRRIGEDFRRVIARD